MNPYGLNEIQMRIMPLIIQDKTNREIADELHYSHHYIKTHVLMLRDKMGAGSRLQAAVQWVREQEKTP